MVHLARYPTLRFSIHASMLAHNLTTDVGHQERHGANSAVFGGSLTANNLEHEQLSMSTHTCRKPQRQEHHRKHKSRTPEASQEKFHHGEISHFNLQHTQSCMEMWSTPTRMVHIYIYNICINTVLICLYLFISNRIPQFFSITRYTSLTSIRCVSKFRD